MSSANVEHISCGCWDNNWFLDTNVWSKFQVELKLYRSEIEFEEVKEVNFDDFFRPLGILRS